MMPRSVILFLAANPAETDPLALDEECAAIERELMLTPGRDDFDLQPTIFHVNGQPWTQ